MSGALVKFPGTDAAILAAELDAERQKYCRLSADYIDVCRELEKVKAKLATSCRDISQMRRGELRRLKAERDRARLDLRTAFENNDALTLAVAQLARGIQVLSNNKREIMDALGLAKPEDAVRLALNLTIEDFHIWSAAVDEISRRGLHRFGPGGI